MDADLISCSAPNPTKRPRIEFESPESNVSYESPESNVSYESPESNVSYESPESNVSYESPEPNVSYESPESNVCYESLVSESESTEEVFPSEDSSSEASVIIPSSDESSSESSCKETPKDVTHGTPTSMVEDLEKISRVLISHCCDNLCVRKITVNEVLLARNKFGLMTTTQQRQWLCDRLIENSSIYNSEWETK